MEKNDVNGREKVKIYKRLFFAGIVGLVVINIFSWCSETFSDWYVENVFPIWLGSYARFTSLFKFSVGEVMITFGVLITIFLIIISIFNFILLKGKYSNFVRIYGIVYAWLFLAFGYVMTFNCFILYHCSGFSDKYMSKEDEAEMLVATTSDAALSMVGVSSGGLERCYTKKEVALLRDFVVEKCNRLATEVERDEEGMAYYDGDLIEVSRSAMQKLGEDYGQLSGYYVTPKYLKYSGFFSQQYIMGYYFPFSLEANVNSDMYVTNVAPTVCHELAHTKGFIFEEDANLIGYLACINSEDVFLQYCGYLSVLNYVNNDFYEAIDNDSTVYKKHIRISDQVADDNIFLTRESWQEVEEKAIVKTATVKKVANKLMDTSLKLNGVDEGVMAYNGVVGLLLQYYEGKLY